MAGHNGCNSLARADSALIAGGGTAGHIVPGLAVAQALTELGWPREQIHFVGSARGLDAELVSAAGFGLTALPGRGINRRGMTRGINGKNLLAVWALMRGITKGIRLVRKFRPAIVLSLGGYAALPGSIGAIVWRVPLVLIEQNAAASVSNRLLSRFAKAAAVPVLGTGLRKEILTGNPVRAEVVALANASVAPGDASVAPGDTNQRRVLRDELGWSDRPAVVVFGGSLGSFRINQATWQVLELLAAPDATSTKPTTNQPFIYHVVGQRDWGERPAIARTQDQTIYRAVPYDDSLPVALAAADLVVCRAGASTVAELSVLTKRAVLVPLPGAPNDHQRRNAEALVTAGQAKIVNDAELDAERLLSEITAGLTARQTAPNNASCSASFSNPQSAHQVAQLAIKFAKQIPRSVTAAGPDSAGPASQSDNQP